MKYILSFLFACLVVIQAGSGNPPTQVDWCRVYGAVYIEKDRSYADFTVFIEEDEGTANLSVYLEDNELYADQSGVWYITNDRNQAHYRIYLERTKSFADFSVAYTNARSFAGCR